MLLLLKSMTDYCFPLRAEYGRWMVFDLRLFANFELGTLWEAIK
jgi:hypothetical protein